MFFDKSGITSSNLQFWNSNETENQALKTYLDNGGMLWLQGRDFLYDVYGSAPDDFVAGEAAQMVVDSNREAIADGWWDRHVLSELLRDLRSGTDRSGTFSDGFYPNDKWNVFVEKIDTILQEKISESSQ